MAIEGFNYKEFVQNLALQAKAVVPQELSPQDRDYVINMVHNFCYLAAEAVSNDESGQFNEEQASVITQLIGEWTFHKSIDVIKGGLPEQFRDPVLQKVAFTIFEIAKQGILKGISQDQLITLVEHHVKKSYTEAINDLTQKGALSQQQAESAMSYSNIDEMAQRDTEAINTASDAKIVKLAAFALVLKKLPQDKAGTILTRFSASDAQVLMQYMQMDNLESQIDKSLMKQCLKDVKSIVEIPGILNPEKIKRNFKKAAKSVPESFLLSLSLSERPFVRQMFADMKNFGKKGMSPYVLNVICSHTEEKINDYKTSKKTYKK